MHQVDRDICLRVIPHLLVAHERPRREAVPIQLQRATEVEHRLYMLLLEAVGVGRTVNTTLDERVADIDSSLHRHL